MKLVPFLLSDDKRNQPRLGALSTETNVVVDLQKGYHTMTGFFSPYLTDMLTLLDGGKSALKEARHTLEFVLNQQPPVCQYSRDRLTLLAPVPRPRSIRDCLAFERHLVQATRTVAKWRFTPLASLDAWLEKCWGRALLGAPRVWYERPIYYKGNPFSVVGPEADVQWPAYTDKLDYELEFGVFIGSVGRNIPCQQAHQYIAGYTIFNDFSARDIQLREMQGHLGPAKGKDFDTGNAMGPYLVTADEITNPYGLTMVARVNGETWSQGSSADMYFTFEEMIAYISQEETLYPGEFIGSGTVGNGCGLELDRWLRPGDRVELEIDYLGVLHNRVVRSLPE